MPNIKSAIKRVRTTENVKLVIFHKNAMRTAVKMLKQRINNNVDNKAELVNFAIKSVDKASQSNLIHSNKGDRIKSQLMSSSK